MRDHAAITRVFDAMERTLDQVRCVGEWHSHPRHHSTNPSDIDVAQIAWPPNTADIHVGGNNRERTRRSPGRTTLGWALALP
jgi:proteasome lid subunit RPN8/RPN11